MKAKKPINSRFVYSRSEPVITSVRLTDEQLAAVDRLRKRHSLTLAKAIRRIVDVGLRHMDLS